jgi:hypothetical protein
LIALMKVPQDFSGVASVTANSDSLAVHETDHARIVRLRTAAFL